jgi:hypothetical protein
MQLFEQYICMTTLKQARVEEKNIKKLLWLIVGLD